MQGTQTPSEVVGEYIRQRRTFLGLSQTQLGQAIGLHGVPMSKQVVARLERGARATSVDDLVAVAKALGTSVGDLVTPLDIVFVVEGRPLGGHSVRELVAAANRLLMESGGSYVETDPRFVTQPLGDAARDEGVVQQSVESQAPPELVAVIKDVLKEHALALAEEIAKGELAVLREQFREVRAIIETMELQQRPSEAKTDG